MAIGRCCFLTCQLELGSSFRGAFEVGPDNYLLHTEVLLCPEHSKFCEQLKEKMPGQLKMTEEGWVYTRFWMDSLVDLA